MPIKRMSAESYMARMGDTSGQQNTARRLSSPNSQDSHVAEARRSGSRRTSKTTDGAESDASLDQAGRTRKKAEPVKSACVQCQKRKTKCSGQRPVCRFCSDRNLECSWDIGDGLTRTADLKRKLQEASERSRDLDTLVDAMRNGTDEVSTMLLAKLRLGDSIEDLASGIRLDLSPGGIRDSESPQKPERTGCSYNSACAEYPSPMSPTHHFERNGLGSQSARVKSNGNWTVDPNQYQPLNAQAFITPVFDHPRVTWQQNGSLYTTEDSPMHNDGMQSSHAVERKDSGVPPQVELVPGCLDTTPVS